jgi:uncharacterized membrane protein YvbJ
MEEKEGEEMWLCPYCGKFNLENDIFCFECGRKREEYEEEEEEEKQRPKRKRIVPY